MPDRKSDSVCDVLCMATESVQTQTSVSLVTSLHASAQAPRIASFWFHKQEHFILSPWSIGFSSGSSLSVSALHHSNMKLLAAVPLELWSKA